MRSSNLVVAGALGTALLTASCCMHASAAVASVPQAAAPVRDGSHDFDFVYGSWRMHNRRLKPPLLSSHAWAKFDSTDEAHPLPGGLGNVDVYRSAYPVKGFVGMTVRLYDRSSGVWRIYWIDNRSSHGDAGQPNVGRWHGNVGIFDERLMMEGRPAIDRYTWTRLGGHSKIAARFQESVSFDDGRTWKLIFANDLIRAAPMAVSAAGTADPSPQPAAAGVRDGSHDFDFEYGKWRMPNQRLVKRLAGSHEWADFVSCDEGMALPGGIGDMDVFRASYWPDFVGVTIRTYDPQTGLWRLYWFDNRFSHGVIEPPVMGRFAGNVGIFEGPDTFNGKPITVRFTWTVDPKGSRAIARWQQAFSTDGGKTWEVNWKNQLIHDDHCSPTA